MWGAKSVQVRIGMQLLDITKERKIKGDLVGYLTKE